MIYSSKGVNMKIGFMLTLLMLVVTFPQIVFSRCNEYYADYLIKQRFVNCKVNLIDGLHNISNYDTACGRDVAAVCMNGCYSALFNESLKPECDRKYVNVLESSKCAKFLAEYSKSVGCTDLGKYKVSKPQEQQSSQTKKDEETPCKWDIRYTLDLTCGETRNTNICSKGARAICSGRILCDKNFQVDDINISSGLHNLACLSKTGYCENIPLNDCIKDPNIEVFDSFHRQKPSSEREGEAIQVRSPR